ncbi:MAG: hypothetical protein ABJA82_11365 [Myxococcales bacterium]
MNNDDGAAGGDVVAARGPALLVCASLMLISGGVAGCAHGTARPAQVIHGFADAVAGHDWEGAYNLMSAGYRARVSLPTFRAQMEAEPAAVSGDAAMLSQAPLQAARAQVDTPSGEQLPLVLEGDQWKLDVQPLHPYRQDSPRAALRTFVRAVDRRRYDIVLRLVPAARRSGVTEATLRAYWEDAGAEEHRRLLDRLRVNLDAAIVDLGSEAQMPFGTATAGSPPQGQGQGRGEGEGEVRFLLEEGMWKIDEINR